MSALPLSFLTNLHRRPGAPNGGRMLSDAGMSDQRRSRSSVRVPEEHAPRMRFFPNTLPIALRLPVLVGVAVFLSSVGTTHLALRIMENERDQEVQRLAGVYVDSLAGLILPLLRAGDLAALEGALERGMGFQRGVSDLAIIVADPVGVPLAHAGQPTEKPPMAYGLTGSRWSPNLDRDTAWVQHELQENGKVQALLAAQLAFPEQAARHRQLTLRLTLLDIILAAAAALLTMLFSRRMMRPILAVTRALEHAGQGRFAPLPQHWSNAEAERLASSFNHMAARLREREELASQLAERERAAVLGRLAASVAHEVRNPLAGMLTALDTIRRFGAQAEPRSRAVELLERGLRQIEAVVRATLASHRQEDEGRPLIAEDLEDLKLLVLPDAQRRDVQLGWSVELPVPFATDALRLRQLLLNLLLNAVAATPPGRRVALTVRLDAADLLAQVEDEAGGLPPEADRRLSGEVPADGSAGLGLEIAAQLAAALGAGIEAGPWRGGSRITLRVPSRGELAA